MEKINYALCPMDGYVWVCIDMIKHMPLDEQDEYLEERRAYKKAGNSWCRVLLLSAPPE